ncbi:MAG TPA: ATP-dependent DNA ligase [Nitrososphaeria archaeon]|nr:ATP-dependent DNA ligase [Conexivisphaerales archaeon]HEU16375.1 ATP-dependent DNA ligase [Nitrososphaeria archaeon]
MSFGELCSVLEKSGSTRSRLAKVAMMSEYLRRLGEEELGIAARFLSGEIYPRGSGLDAGVGYRMLLDVAAQVTGASEEELLHAYRAHGDLGDALQEILGSGRIVQSPLMPAEPLSLKGVYDEFVRLAGTAGEGSYQRKIVRLRGLLTSCSPLEAKYVVKLLLGELRTGAVEGVVEQAIAEAFGAKLEDVKRARLMTGDLGEVAVLAKRGALGSVGISPLRPLDFMLAEALASPEEAVERYPGKALIAEYKYDGVRAQVHVVGEEVRIFSRRLEDITWSFPEVVEGVRGLDAVLDGEVVAFRDGTPLPFHELQRRLRRKNPHELSDEVPVVYFAYDVLYMDGRSLVDMPLSERKRWLSELLPERRGVVSTSPWWTVRSAEEIAELFRRSRDEGYEGLMLKDPDSTYELGKRGWKWMKLKEELDTLDAVVVGAEYGHGKRAGLLSDLIFAVWDGDSLKVVGKAYSGLTDREIEWVTKRLRELEIRDEGLRIYVRPEIVVEVAFDLVQESDRHVGGYALRFPRIKALRSDKGPEDADTMDKLRWLAEMAKRRGTSH